MTNRRQFFAALCGLGVGGAVAATPITPDVPPTDATIADVPLQIRSHNAVCNFQVDAQGRLWIRSNEGPYRRVVTE